MLSGRMPTLSLRPPLPAVTGRRLWGTGSLKPSPSSASPLAESVAEVKLMGGEPMNWATKTLAGRSYTSSGVPSCCSLPSFITAMRWPIVMASI